MMLWMPRCGLEERGGWIGFGCGRRLLMWAGMGGKADRMEALEGGGWGRCVHDNTWTREHIDGGWECATSKVG